MFTPERARGLGGISAGLGLVLLAYGVLAFVSASGSTGLGALAGFAMGVGLSILGLVPLLLGLLAWRASFQLEPGGGSARTSGLPRLATVTALLWALPALGALLATVLVGSWALPDGTGEVVGAAVVIGALLTLGALLARSLPVDSVAATIRLLVAVSLVIPIWESTVIAGSFNPSPYLRAEHERAAAQQQAQEGARTSFQARYRAILSGPPPERIAVVADGVGSWRVVSAGYGPTAESCGSSSGCSGASARYLPSWDRIGALSGKRVRFLVVGQCWVEGVPGTLRARILSRNPGWPMVEVVAGPCDGRLRMASSAGTLLPVWSSEEIAAMASPSASAMFGMASAYWPKPGMPSERAERWVLLVSPEPASDPAAVMDALRPIVSDLEIR